MIIVSEPSGEAHEVIIETIAATTTKTGLTVRAVLDTSTYPKGIKISDKEMKEFETAHLARHEFHGNWNYTISGQDRPGPANTRHAERAEVIASRALSVGPLDLGA